MVKFAINQTKPETNTLINDFARINTSMLTCYKCTYNHYIKRSVFKKHTVKFICNPPKMKSRNEWHLVTCYKVHKFCVAHHHHWPTENKLDRQ